MGIGVIHAESGELKMLHLGVLNAAKGEPISERLHTLYCGVLECIDEWKPTEVAIEEPFVAKNVRSAMAVGQAQAAAMLAAASKGLSVATYSPREVKQAVTDYGGSSKEQVQGMVRIMLDLPELPIPSDAADALAVAICHVNSSHVRDLTFID